jgi:hypothetical protein
MFDGIPTNQELSTVGEYTVRMKAEERRCLISNLFLVNP